MIADGAVVLARAAREPRIENQLRGRSGRQGDPGLSRFYLSLDDDLLRIFGPQTMFSRLMNKNLEDGEAIVSPWISKAIETAQKKVEARNYDIRKQVVEYDDVMNDQRKVIYEQRADIMDADTVGDVVVDMRAETVNSIVGESLPPNTYPEQWDVEMLKQRTERVFALQPAYDDWIKEESVDPEMFVDRLQAMVDAQIEESSRRSRPTPGCSTRKRCCSRRWTIIGKSICRCWMRCARSCIFAPTRRRSRSTSISMRRLRCSSGCWARSART